MRGRSSWRRRDALSSSSKAIPAPTGSRRTRVVAVAGVTLLLVALATCSVLPAWSMLALPIVLATSELSPALALVTFVWRAGASRLLASRPRSRRVVRALLLVAVVVELLPLAQFWGTVGRANAELRTLGLSTMTMADALRGIPAAPDVRERTVSYTAGDGTPLTMRLYDRGGHAGVARPVVVTIYGGAWRGGEPTQGTRVSRALAQRGYLVVAIDYRHAPRSRFPAQLEDVRRSLAVIRDSASAWGADLSRLAMLGRSAGGHLAELSAFAPGGPTVRGVVAIYAPWNLAEGYRDLPTPDPIGVREVIGNFVGGSPAQRPAEYRAASPSSYVRAGLPPTLLLYGARDHLVKPDFNRAAARALRSAEVGVVAVEVPWSEHGFDLVPGGLGERLAWGVVERFLGAVVGNGG